MCCAGNVLLKKNIFTSIKSPEESALEFRITIDANFFHILFYFRWNRQTNKKSLRLIIILEPNELLY